MSRNGLILHPAPETPLFHTQIKYTGCDPTFNECRSDDLSPTCYVTPVASVSTTPYRTDAVTPHAENGETTWWFVYLYFYTCFLSINVIPSHMFALPFDTEANLGMRFPSSVPGETIWPNSSICMDKEGTIQDVNKTAKSDVSVLQR